MQSDGRRPGRAALVEALGADNHAIAMAMVRGGLDPMTRMPLPTQQLKVLLTVSAGNVVTATDLADALGVGPATVTGLVDRLVERGLVTRAEVPGDRRSRRIEATDDGQRLVRRVTGFDHGHMAAIVEQLGDDELAALATGMAAVRRAVEALGGCGDDLPYGGPDGGPDGDRV